MASRTAYNTWTPQQPTLFDGHYLRNRSTLDIGVLGYIGIVEHKVHSPEILSIPPGTPVYMTLHQAVSHIRQYTKLCFMYMTSHQAVFHIYDTTPNCVSYIWHYTKLCFMYTSHQAVFHIYNTTPSCVSYIWHYNKLCFIYTYMTLHQAVFICGTNKPLRPETSQMGLLFALSFPL